jgi:FtsZ-binding cell division protein ZapB
MQENGTVQQLSNALNQLLDAYEILQGENKQLKDENTSLKEEIDDLELRNRGLDSKVCALSDTTKHHSSEMDTMLGRIETILGPSITKEDNPQEEIEEEILEEIVEEVTTEEGSLLDQQTSFYPKQDDNKEIDLGRMQSLLNGFSN